MLQENKRCCGGPGWVLARSLFFSAILLCGFANADGKDANLGQWPQRVIIPLSTPLSVQVQEPGSLNQPATVVQQPQGVTSKTKVEQKSAAPSTAPSSSGDDSDSDSPKPASTGPATPPHNPNTPPAQATNPIPSGQSDSRYPISSGSLLDSTFPPSPLLARASNNSDDGQYEPGELILVSPGMDEAVSIAEELSPQGYRVLRRRKLTNLGLVFSIFRVPSEQKVASALTALRKRYPKLQWDANHRYGLLGDKPVPRLYAAKLIGWKKTLSGCDVSQRIGLVDTAIDTTHATLKHARIVTYSTLANGITPAPSDHGTAIATLLVGQDSASYGGLLPRAELYAVNIFRQRDKRHVDTLAESMVLAFDWLLARGVKVINLSFGGPRNLLVELAVRRLLDRGVVLIAAAGNKGKRLKSNYPAAYQGVIAVTAIDAALKPYRYAARGDYISFAAPGVDVWTAVPERINQAHPMPPLS